MTMRNSGGREIATGSYLAVITIISEEGNETVIRKTIGVKK